MILRKVNCECDQSGNFSDWYLWPGLLQSWSLQNSRPRPFLQDQGKNLTKYLQTKTLRLSTKISRPRAKLSQSQLKWSRGQRPWSWDHKTLYEVNIHDRTTIVCQKWQNSLTPVIVILESFIKSCVNNKVDSHFIAMNSTEGKIADESSGLVIFVTVVAGASDFVNSRTTGS